MKDSSRVYKWKSRGLNHTEQEINEILKIYHKTTNCNLCDKQLTDGKNCGSQKCMDHDHKTGKFRQILCRSCNIHYDSAKRLVKRRFTEEERKQRQKESNRLCDIKRKDNPDRKEYMKDYMKD